MADSMDFICRGSDGVLRLYDEHGVSVVLTAAEVRYYGLKFLDALNRGQDSRE